MLHLLRKGSLYMLRTIREASALPLIRRVVLALVLVSVFELYSQRANLARWQPGVTKSMPLPDTVSHVVATQRNGVIRDGIILNATTILSHVNAVFDPASSTLDRLECPMVNSSRYDSLRVDKSTTKKIEYIFPLNLRDNLPLLPTLLSALVEAMKFLGPRHCLLSIVEGNSPDGTFEVLEVLQSRLEAIGVSYTVQSTALNPSEGDRIGKLAALRNAALRPALENEAGVFGASVSHSAVVVFLNDVLACAEDILELTLQLRRQDADMTCAMDWEFAEPPRYYDCWIGRSISGDTFWEFPEDMSWGRSDELFWNEPKTAARFRQHLPIQVFSCWNGGVAFRLEPLLEGLRFRAPNQTIGECEQGEPQLFCADLWKRGYGKIAVIPSVNFGYTKSDFQYIKKQMGFVSDWVRGDQTGDLIEWSGPPAMVKCVEPWSRQFWQPWNKTQLA